ncbi:MAG: hypothetical protein ACLQPV_06860 [Vulcanimicrobiaceae bacterium]
MKLCVLMTSVLTAALFAFAPLAAGARSTACVRSASYDLELAKQIGDVYNQVSSDGDELWPSYFAKGTYRNGQYAYTVQTHRSEYDTQHAGAATQTVVHTIAGPTVSVPWFVALDQTSELRVEGCIHVMQFYAGLGFLQTNTNYGYPIGYGPLRGAGFGIERYADPSRRFDVFTALFFYPNASSAYGPTVLAFQDTTFDGGVRWRPVRSHFALVAGLYQELRAVPGIRVAQTIRASPYVGISLAH